MRDPRPVHAGRGSFFGDDQPRSPIRLIMPGWIIEWFANEALTQLFWIITLAGLPFWVLMIVFPRKPITRKLCSPLLAPSVMTIGVLYLYWQLWDLGLPDAPTGVTYSDQAAIATHPIVLLILWLKVQTLNLFLGESLFVDAAKRKMPIPIELILCWLFGPVGLLAYALRIGVAAPFKR